MADARLCADVLDTGVYMKTDEGREWPHCIDVEKCTAGKRCLWRGFHQIADDEHRRKQETAQQELFECPPIT